MKTQQNAPKTIRIRFNLGKGENFKKWQISGPEGVLGYYDPKLFSIIAVNCINVNHESTAKKINNGADKTVCAWIQCESFKIVKTEDLECFNIDKTCSVLSYNPRDSINWKLNENEIPKRTKFFKLITIDRLLYLV